MPYQQVLFAVGEYYHLFNRGVEKRQLFLDKRDFQRFLLTMEHYRFKDPGNKFSFKNRKYLLNQPDCSLLVEVVCYCLMPNHFHLIVKQSEEGGITCFMSKILNSYTKYFNVKHHRVGPLFQGSFKAVRVENQEQLVHLSRYVHINPVVDYLVKDPLKYKYSSLSEFLGLNKGWCSMDSIMSSFVSTADYKQFLLDQVDYGRFIKLLQRMLFEETSS